MEHLEATCGIFCERDGKVKIFVTCMPFEVTRWL